MTRRGTRTPAAGKIVKELFFALSGRGSWGYLSERLTKPDLGHIIFLAHQDYICYNAQTSDTQNLVSRELPKPSTKVATEVNEPTFRDQALSYPQTTSAQSFVRCLPRVISHLKKRPCRIHNARMLTRESNTD